MQILEEKFGGLFEVGAVKGLLTRDPVAEMGILERDYLARSPGLEKRETWGTRRMGRLGIVARMQDAFSAAGVLELLQRDIEMTEFTGENDPFKVDFGFRVGSSLKMFHALALSISREPAVTLAYRFGRIREGMIARGDEALLTAVISERQVSRQPSAISLQERGGDIDSGAAQEEWRARSRMESGVAMLREKGIRVRGVEEMGEIAEEVRNEVRG